MLGKLIQAVVVGVVITLGCLLVGAILEVINVKLATTVARFLTTYAAAFGVLGALWFFFSGAALPSFKR